MHIHRAFQQESELVRTCWVENAFATPCRASSLSLSIHALQLVERFPNIRLWLSGHFHLSHNYEDSISVVGRYGSRGLEGGRRRPRDKGWGRGIAGRPGTRGWGLLCAMDPHPRPCMIGVVALIQGKARPELFSALFPTLFGPAAGEIQGLELKTCTP